MVFLSGSSNVSDFTKEKKFYNRTTFPTISLESLTGNPVDFSQDSEAVGNHRLVGYFRDNSGKQHKPRMERLVKKRDFLPQVTLTIVSNGSKRLLLDGAFNINSTSVDAWVAQL